MITRRGTDTGAEPTEINVVEHWFQELTERVLTN